MKILQVIETAYRATVEEQDDTIVWLTHALCGAGAPLDVLLQGNAVNYAVRRQDASGLRFGDWQQRRAPTLAADIESLIPKGVRVHVVADDLTALGLTGVDLVDGVTRIERSRVAALFAEYDQIWQW